MKNSIYPEQCFSSQCGLCFSCTNALHPTPVKHEETDKDKSQPKTLSYSEVIGKFEKPRITEMGETYVRTLLKLNAREERDDCETSYEKYFGIIPANYKANESHDVISVFVKWYCQFQLPSHPCIILVNLKIVGCVGVTFGRFDF